MTTKLYTSESTLRNYKGFSFLGILAMLAACDLSINAPGGDDNPPPPDEKDVTLSVNGEEQEVTTFDNTMSTDSEGASILQLEIFSDPDQDVADDELTITVTLRMNDLNRLALGTPIAVGQNVDDLIEGSFEYSCFCANDSTAPSQITGSITFEKISENRLKGEADLLLRGASANGIELERVDLFAAFDASTRP